MMSSLSWNGFAAWRSIFPYLVRERWAMLCNNTARGYPRLKNGGIPLAKICFSELLLDCDRVFRALFNASHTDEAGVFICNYGHFLVVVFPFFEHFYWADFYAHPVRVAFFIIYCHFGHVVHLFVPRSVRYLGFFLGGLTGSRRVPAIAVAW